MLVTNLYPHVEVQKVHICTSLNPWEEPIESINLIVEFGLAVSEDYSHNLSEGYLLRGEVPVDGHLEEGEVFVQSAAVEHGALRPVEAVFEEVEEPGRNPSQQP